MPVENDRDGAENTQPAPGGFVWGLKPQVPAAEVPAAEVPAAEVPAAVAAAVSPEAGEPVPLIVPTPAFWVPVALPPAAPAPLDAESSVPAPLVPAPLVPPPLVPPPLAVPRIDDSELRAALFTPPVPLVPPAPLVPPQTEQTAQTEKIAQTEKTEALGLDSLFGTLHGATEPGTAPTSASPAAARNTFTPAAPAAGFADPASATPTAAALVRERTGRDTTGGTSGTPVSRILIWVAAGLLGVVLLLGLFFLGQQLAGSPAPVAEPSASATPTPTPTPTVTGTLPAGVHAWDTLNGGECLEPYVSPWEEDFTVVDCAEAHTAQLVYVAPFAEAAGDFPGEDALASQVNLLCSIPGVIDLTAAGEFPDVQVQGSYPVTAEQWDAGNREYSCFVSRASAEPLTATLAGPGPVPAG